MSQTLVVLAALTSGAIYLVSGHLTSGFPARLSMSPVARRHLVLLAAVFFLLLAWGAWLTRAGYLVEPSGMIFGASYADVYGRMPAALLLMAVAVVGAALAAWHAFGEKNWPIPLAIGLYIVVSIGGEVYSSVLQRFVVTPNEQVRETPFIEHNIAATRRAFGLDERRGASTVRRCAPDAQRHHQQCGHARERPPLGSPAAARYVRPDPGDPHVLRLRVGRQRPLHRSTAQLRQVMLSARELNSNEPAEPHVGERATDLHARLRPDAGPGEPGHQRRTARPLRARTCRLKRIHRFEDRRAKHLLRRAVERLRDRAHAHAGVPLSARRRERVHAVQRARGGVALGSLWRKLMFALRFGAYQIVLSDDITAESRILFNRNIRERVDEIAPFLRLLDQRSVSRPRRRTAVLVVRRLHDEHAVSVLDAGGAGELHPQLGEVRHRRLQRHDDRVSRRH